MFERITMQPFIPHFIQEQYLANRFNGSIEGCVLFVDISGFTPMTQQLMEKGQKEGAEVLSNILNSIFEVMIHEVYQFKGFITHFAGDAFTSLFPINVQASQQATFLATLQCALNTQAFFQQNGNQKSKFGSFQLQVKIGLSYGEIDWGIIGNSDIMGLNAHKFYFKGRAIDEAAAAEQQAQKGETILGQSFKQIVQQSQLKGSYISPSFFRLEAAQVLLPVENGLSSNVILSKIQSEILERFVPNEVIAFREQGEFRNIISIFISFKGIDNHQELDTFASIVLKHIIRYKGDLKEIEFGDKGALMVGFFGAPVTYENDIARALYFVEEVENEVQEYEELSDLQFRIGITSGKVYAGIIGGKYRCEYTCLGNIANIAARITMHTHWREIWVNEAIAAHPNFQFESKGTFPYKGFPLPIKTYEYLGKSTSELSSKNQAIIIGRDKDLEELRQGIQPLFEGKSAGIVYVFGEAGIGKTRLIHALRQETQPQLQWLQITADQILQKPFQPFKDLLSVYFLSNKQHSREDKKMYFETQFENLATQLNQQLLFIGGNQSLDNLQSENRIALLQYVQKELLRTRSILALQIGVDYDEVFLQQLSAMGRYQNTILAIQNFLKVLSLIQPLVIHLEDAQWLDVDSISLFQKLSNNLSSYPIAILSTARYKDDGSPAILSLVEIPSHTIELSYLEQAQVKKMAENRLNQANKEKEWVPLEETLLEELMERSKGNPFFVEQLLEFFGENQLLQSRTGTWRLTQQVDSIPNSIQALLMARIDRLSKQVKEVVKVAAVIGREFDLQLLSNLLERNVLAEAKVAATEQIWLLPQELKGIFRHTLLRDMAYDMQLKAQLRNLHQMVAATMEGAFAKSSSEKYADIAFHYERSETTIKAIEYLHKAAIYAKDNYQNQQALNLFDRLLKQLQKLEDGDFIFRTLLKKADVLRTIGKWKLAEKIYEEAFDWAYQLQNEGYGMEVTANLARILSLKGEYMTSLEHYQKALNYYELTNNKREVASTVGYMAVVYLNLSQHEKAAQYFQRQIALASELGDQRNHATALGNLGSLFNQTGNYPTALDCYQKSFELFEKIGFSQNAAMNLANMGTLATVQNDYDSAMDYYEQSLERFEKVGYQYGMAHTIVNIGYTLRQKGLYDEAIVYFEKSLRLSWEMQDSRLRGFAEGNIGLVYFFNGAYKRALKYLDSAIEGHRKIGFKQSLAEWFWAKGLCLYELAAYMDALECVKEAIEISKVIKKKNIIFKAQLLEWRIRFKMGEEKEAIDYLRQLLLEVEVDEESAKIHFELWKMVHSWNKQLQKKTSEVAITSEVFNDTGTEYPDKVYGASVAERHRQKALQLFRKLIAQKSKKEYERNLQQLIDGALIG